MKPSLKQRNLTRRLRAHENIVCGFKALFEMLPSDKESRLEDLQEHFDEAHDRLDEHIALLQHAVREMPGLKAGDEVVSFYQKLFRNLYAVMNGVERLHEPHTLADPHESSEHLCYSALSPGIAPLAPPEKSDCELVLHDLRKNLDDYILRTARALGIRVVNLQIRPDPEYQPAEGDVAERDECYLNIKRVPDTNVALHECYANSLKSKKFQISCSRSD